MLGQHFSPGIVYLDGGRWLRVLTRGPLITRGMTRPMVRMTAHDGDGTIHRVQVYAGQLYRTATALPGEPAHVKPLPARRRILRTYDYPVAAPEVTPEVPARPTRPARVPVAATRSQQAPARRKKSRPHVKILKQNSHYCTEACYWLPPNTGGLSPTLYDVIEAMSELLWEDAAERHWDREGTLVEHEIPSGLTLPELACRVYHIAMPSDHHLQSLERSLVELMRRNMVERATGDTRRFRLRGWQCLHTRRRTTRRAIERGGGRAVYATVRFSA